MTDELEQKHASTHDDFEHQDLSLRPVFIALVALGVICLTVAAIVWGLYGYLDKENAKSQPELNPLVTNTVPDPRSATRQQFREEIKREFPDPRLEEDERGQLNSIRLGEEQTLNSYGWVDEKAGVVRIPITRAMELVAQRGLPVAPSGTGAGPGQAASAQRIGRRTK